MPSLENAAMRCLGRKGSATVWLFQPTRKSRGHRGRARATPRLAETLDPSVGIDESGRVTLLYNPTPDMVVRDFAAGTSVLAVTRETLSLSCSAISQDLAVAPSGDAVAGYDCGGAIFALRRAGRWAVSPKVADNFPSGCTSSTDVSAPSVAIDGAGNAVGLLRSTTTQRFGIGFCQTSSTSTSVSLALPLGGFLTPVPGPPAVNATPIGFFGFPVTAPTAAISPAGIVLAWGDTTDSLRAVPKARFYAVDGSGGSAPQTVGSMPGVRERDAARAGSPPARSRAERAPARTRSGSAAGSADARSRRADTERR
jgi:hypothetical protein